ncbi:MAG TPA: hypothetical protein PK177_16830, partial [Burkholderiaceae bacterium]|nr:hypothetical protein [Burkholderiaceae bacterium]
MGSRHWIVGALACLPWLHISAAAADYPPELPAIEQVLSAIDESPEVRSALALGTASAAERRQLIAGPHEWSMQVGYQRRRADESPQMRRFNEWDVALERPLRRPDKARIDRELGDQRIVEAAAMLADARHEASKRLLGLWYQWLRERASADVASRQAELSAREYAAIARRKDLGDASSLEAIQAQAASARAEALARQAADRAQRAELVLREQFPQVAAAPLPPLPAPILPAGSPQELADAFIERDQGVRVARAAAERSRLESQRAAAERRPDPTVGVR